MKLPNRFYVYIVFRPNGVPCYVGKGQGNRWLTHLYKSCNNHLKYIAAKAGGTLPIAIIRDNLIENEAFIIEMAFIAAIGRKDLGKGPLVNRTDGGEGLSGPMAIHTRLKISKTKTGLRASPEHIAAQKAGIALAGRSVDDKTRAKISATMTGRPLTEKNVEGIKIGVTAYWANGGAGHKSCVCITDGKINTRIYGDAIIPEGWYRGITKTWVVKKRILCCKNTINVIYDGISMNLTEACRRSEISLDLVRCRIRRRGLSPQDAFDLIRGISS